MGSRTNMRTKDSTNPQDSVARAALNAWLGISWTNDLYHSSQDRTTEGTCTWIRDRSVFVEWASNNFPSDDAKFLWIHGLPGFGKHSFAQLPQSISRQRPVA